MITGAIHVDEDAQPSALMPHLAERLRHVSARHIAIDGNRITFKGGVFRFVSRWNVLVPFGSGELEFLPATRQVRYRLSLAHLIIVSTVLTGLMGVLLFCYPQFERAPEGGAAFFLGFAWVVFVGGNLLLGIPRFRNFLRQSISTAPRERGG